MPEYASGEQLSLKNGKVVVRVRLPSRALTAFWRNHMSANSDSWEKKNNRRIALIHKEIADQLSKEEEQELQDLQDLADARVQAILDHERNHTNED